MKRNLLSITVGILLLAIFLLWLCAFQVRQSEVALVTTFGKPDANPIVEPGAYLKWPPPIQRVHKFDKRIQNFEDKFEPTQTQDSNILMTMVFVGWQVSDPAPFFSKFASGSIAEPERGSIAVAETKLKDMVRSAKSAVVGRHPLSDFISTDPAQLKFEAIESEILAIIQGQVKTNNYGIEVKYLGLKKLGVPESVTQEVFKQMTSERQILIGAIQFKGEREVANIHNQANSDSQKILAEADAEAKRIKGDGEAKAAEFFAVFQKDPEFEEYLLNLDALRQALKSQTTLILSGSTLPFNLLQNSQTNSTNSAARRQP